MIAVRNELLDAVLADHDPALTRFRRQRMRPVELSPLTMGDADIPADRPLQKGGAAGRSAVSEPRHRHLGRVVELRKQRQRVHVIGLIGELQRVIGHVRQTPYVMVNTIPELCKTAVAIAWVIPGG
jgi:hypothetical protein